MTEASTDSGRSLAASVVKARRGFFKMSMREKSLLLLFAFALIAVWFTWQLDRHRATQSAIASAHRVADEHQMVLSYAPGVQAAYQELISRIDLATLPSRDDVSSRIDALVREAGFSNFDLGQARTEEGTGFQFHTIQLVVQQVTYPQIKDFTDTLKAELPFVSLERIVIQAQPRDDAYLDVRYVFKSIEPTT